MAEREKVIRGLEAHANPQACETCAGEECPYYNMGGGFTDVTCSSILAADALALLKEQEPRVMTLEEANETLMHGDFVIMEDRETDMIWLGMRGDDNIDLASGEYFDFDDLEKQEYRHEYGRSFRFWTSRPTDEQRKAVKWNE